MDRLFFFLPDNGIAEEDGNLPLFGRAERAALELVVQVLLRAEPEPLCNLCLRAAGFLYPRAELFLEGKFLLFRYHADSPLYPRKSFCF